MKRLALLLSAIFLTNMAFCQEEKKVSVDDEVFVIVEEQAEFPGGLDSMYAYIVKNLKYPEAAKEKGIAFSGGGIKLSYQMQRRLVSRIALRNFKHLKSFGVKFGSGNLPQKGLKL